METPSTTPLPLESDQDESIEPGGAGQPILAVIVTAAVLYFARDVLIPLAVASLLAVIFSPIAGRLEPLLGRFASSVLVVVSAIMVIVGIGYFLTVELTSVAVQVTDYTDNIAAKITALRGSTPQWLERIEDGVKDVERQVQAPTPRPKASHLSTVVQMPASDPVFETVLRPSLPIISAIIESFFIIVLFFFLLYSRKDLRDRLVRLAARARITLSAEGIATAAGAVGHYLLLFSLTNAGYGLTIGSAMWLLGLPNPALWGVLAALLRFIPYVGVLVAGVLPASVAFAVFPGWSRSVEVLGSFIIADQAVGYLVEPFLIGRGIGLSPLALLVSAMFWSWLWGLPGLFLATSLTACLKVAGDYIPALGFFAVLLGADGVLEDYNDYYRTLLELDVAGAREIAVRYCDKHGLEPTFDDVLIPAVRLAGEERDESHISRENQRLINDTTQMLVTELGERFSRPRISSRLRILGVCVPGEVHRLGLRMILELFRRGGAAANLLDESKSPEEIRQFVKAYAPDLLFVSFTMLECAPAALELVRNLKVDSPGLTIICGGAGGLSEASQLLQAGASQICQNRSELRRAVRLYALRRSVLRAEKLGREHPRDNGFPNNARSDGLAGSADEPHQVS
ncbi:MAG TPA: AI-2E family transporter [Candidatus Binataceae bacterium]|nr:AI-2E family transporter [Candidatus Binataceae bacterium]